jgi:DNA-binding transcriptional ArsR family regulator
MGQAAKQAPGIPPSPKLQRTAQIAKALAHPSRLLMLLELLAAGERCVCELAALVGADISTVSRHLAVLRVAGLVRDRKQGQQVFYSLRNPEVRLLLGAADQLLEAVVREQQSALGAGLGGLGDFSGGH